ncbi:MAG TPA: hypothetical protein VGF55_34315 [Gemmataceae bacterium]
MTKAPWSVTGLSRSRWYRLAALDKVPLPVSVGGGRFWRVRDLVAWAEKLPPMKAVGPRVGRHRATPAAEADGPALAAA